MSTSTNLSKVLNFVNNKISIGACLFSISLNKLYQIFKASLGSSTYSTLLNGAYDKSFKNSLSKIYFI
jgi:hypothetical protein